MTGARIGFEGLPMSPYLKPYAEWSAALVETLGIAVIVIVSLYVVLFGLWRLATRANPAATYRDVRQRLGRGILVGLEFLVAADIIHTVAVELTWQSVGVLAVIVLVRTFLSFTLEVELTGRWPWQEKSP